MKKIERIFQTWLNGLNKFQTWKNSKLTSVSFGFAKKNSFQSSDKQNQLKRKKKRNKKRNQNNKPHRKRNNNPRKNNNLRKNNNQRNKPNRKVMNKKIGCQRKKLIHSMFYQNLHSILKDGRDKSAILKINSEFWRNFGLALILKDGLFGEFTILNTKVNIYLILGEGVVGYLTKNLKNGHIRNIDHFRKYCFASYGIYGTEGNYEIEGIWMWRGTEIPMEWK